MNVLKRIFYFIAIFGISLILASCKSKKTSILQEKKVVSDHRQLKKDSISEVKNEVKTAEFSFEKEQSFEMEIVSDKEKDSVIYERIRSPTAEKIIVRGGSLRLKTTQHSADKITKKDTLTIKQASLRTILEEEKVAERKIFTKEEKKDTSHNLPLKMIFWIVIILVGIFIAWRLARRGRFF